MTRTFIFILVVSFTLSARAKMDVIHLQHGLPAHCGIDSVDTNNSFFKTNSIPIVGYTREHSSLRFTFNVRACADAHIKLSAYTVDYAFLNDSTLLVKLQLNPSYIESLSEQGSCYQKHVLNIGTIQQTTIVPVASDIKKRYGKMIDLNNLTVIVANDYQNEHNVLDVTSLKKIERFTGQTH